MDAFGWWVHGPDDRRGLDVFDIVADRVSYDGGQQASRRISPSRSGYACVHGMRSCSSSIPDEWGVRMLD